MPKKPPAPAKRAPRKPRQSLPAPDLTERAKPVLERKLAFARAFFVCADAARAAREVGYTKAKAAMVGGDLLADPVVTDELERLDALHAAHINRRMLVELARLALVDVRDLLNPVTGAPLPPGKWPDHAAAAVESVTTKVDGSITIKVASKSRSLETYMRHLGMFERDNRQKTDPLADLLKTLHSGAAEPLPAIEG